MIKKVICITALLVSTFTLCDDDYAKTNNLAIIPYNETQQKAQRPSSDNLFITHKKEKEEEPVEYSQPQKQIDPQIQGIVNELEATQEKVANGKKFLEQLFPVLEKEIGPRKLSETEHQLIELMNMAYAIRILALEMERDRRLISLMFMEPKIGTNLVQQAIERGITLKDNRNQLQANPLDVLQMWARMMQQRIQEHQNQ